MNNVEPRKAGRPSIKQTPSKKGFTSWKPASALDVENKEDGYRYRWVNKTPDNLSKKAQEGWETVSGLQADSSLNTDNGRIFDGKPTTTVREKHDVILQRIPEELAQERDAYFQNETNRRTAGLTAHIKRDLQANKTTAHGNITISSRSGEQIID